jgi:hypothetical protein
MGNRLKVIFSAVLVLTCSSLARSTEFVRTQMSETWTSFKPSDQQSIFVYGISAIVEHEGALFIGAEKRGLLKYRDGVFEDLNAHIHASHVRAIFKGKDGSLWVSYDKWGGRGSASPADKDGIARYSNGQWQQFDIPDLIPGFAVELNRVFPTRDGALWFFALGRLIRFKDGHWSLSPKVDQPRHFLEARDGSIWVTGEGGEHIWRSMSGSEFQAVTGSDGVNFSYPNHLVETPDGTIWIGDYGLTFYRNGTFGRIEAKPTFDDNRIWPEFASRDGTLYVATAFGGLYPYRDGKWLPGENTKWPFSGAVLETKDGDIWYSVGSWNGSLEGVAHYSRGVWQLFTEITPNVPSSVQSLHEGSDGSIWVGIKTGYIARYSGGEWRTIRRAPPTSIAANSESVSTWSNASNGSLWLGMNTGELRRFTQSSAKLNVTIDGNIINLALIAGSGLMSPSLWSVKYGFSSSAQTPPAEIFEARLGADGKFSTLLGAVSQRVFLHAVAIDADGTAVQLSDGSSFGPVVVSEGAAGLPELPVAAGTITGIDGRPVSNGALEFRGDSETFGSSVYQSLSDGFHSAQLAAQNSALRLMIWKDKQAVKVFRPFSRSVAIIIAVSTYNLDSGYQPLPAAELQAIELEAALRDQGFETVKLLGPAANKINISNTIANINVGYDDRLLIYFGGHGDARELKGVDVGYIVPFGAKRTQLLETGIQLSDMIESYSKQLHARQILYIFDSCQSGLALKRGEIDGAALRRVKAYEDIKYYSQNGRMVLTAGALGEAAIDVNGGIFTRAFVDGIRGRADQDVGDKNGLVDFYELFAYLHREVTTEASRRGFLQHPDFSTSGGMGRFFFVADHSLTK